MPVVKNKVFTYHVNKNEEELIRAYKSKTLVHGVFNVVYYYGSDLTDIESISIENEITSYTWGLDYPIPTEDGVEYEGKTLKLVYEAAPAPDNYFHKWYGWWTFKDWPIYEINQDYCWDLTLYSKWKQKRFLYRGTYEYTELVWEEY